MEFVILAILTLVFVAGAYYIFLRPTDASGPDESEVEDDHWHVEAPQLTSGEPHEERFEQPVHVPHRMDPPPPTLATAETRSRDRAYLENRGPVGGSCD